MTSHILYLHSMINAGWKPGLDDLTPIEWRGLEVFNQAKGEAEKQDRMRPAALKSKR